MIKLRTNHFAVGGGGVDNFSIIELMIISRESEEAFNLATVKRANVADGVILSWSSNRGKSFVKWVTNGAGFKSAFWGYKQKNSVLESWKSQENNRKLQDLFKFYLEL